jgi:hypothetical protein
LSTHPRRLHGASQRGRWAELATPSDLKVTFKLETYVERVQPGPGSPTSELALSKLRRLDYRSHRCLAGDPQPLSPSPGNLANAHKGRHQRTRGSWSGSDGAVYPLFRGGSGYHGEDRNHHTVLRCRWGSSAVHSAKTTATSSGAISIS